MFFMNGQQIYDNFQDGVGPEGLTGSAAIVNEVAGDYETRAQEIRALVTEMEAAWEGEASGAARRGAAPMASEHELSGPSLTTAQDVTNRQAEAYMAAKNAVVPVPPEPVLTDPMQAMMTSPDGLTSYEDQLDAHNAAARNNVNEMNRYTSASAGNWDGLPPSYGTFVDGTSGDPSEVTVSTGEAGLSSRVIDSGDSGPGGEPGDSAGEGEPGSGAPGPGPGGVIDGPVSGDQAPPGASDEPGTGSESTTPGGVTSGAAPPVGPVAGGGDSSVGTGRPPGAPGLGAGVFAGPGFTGGPGGSPGGGPGSGPRGGGVAGPRGGVLGPVAEPAGPRPGPSGVVPGSGRGGAGMGGVPMGAAGRGRDGEDTERTRPPYLEGGDRRSCSTPTS